MQSRTLVRWGMRAVSLIAGLILLTITTIGVLTARTADRVYGGQTTLAEHHPFHTEIRPTAITNVSVLSPDGEEMLPNRTVYLNNGKIVSVVEDGAVPDDTFVIDGREKFLIPGLIDSHIHLQRSPNDLLLYVANGVTQIRSMGGSDADLVLKQEIQNGRIGPHFYVSSPSMNSSDMLTARGPGWFSGPLAVWFIETAFNIHGSSDAAGAAEDARSFAQKGYDGIKLYGFLDMESYDAILDVAEELNIRTVGHLPDAMPLSALRTTKLEEIGHIEEIVKALMVEAGDLSSRNSDAFLAFVESRRDKISTDLVANDIAVHSTLWLTESFIDQVFDLEKKITEVNLEYANPAIVEGHAVTENGWLPGSNKFQAYAGNTPEEISRNREFWETRERAHHILFEAMIARGVNILAATDSNGWFTIPGFALHDELRVLNRLGMTPAQALRAATAAPAEAINNNAGIIEAGRRADLVLLNENPLDNIKNTTTIDTVVLNGRVSERERLDAMLEAVRVANASSRQFDISLYE